LNIIKGIGGFYEVRHDGIKVTDSDTNSYTTGSCSTWTFLPTTPIITGLTSNLLRNGVIVLIALLILFVTLAPLIGKMELSVAYFITVILIVIFGTITIGFILNLI